MQRPLVRPWAYNLVDGWLNPPPVDRAEARLVVEKIAFMILWN